MVPQMKCSYQIVNVTPFCEIPDGKILGLGLPKAEARLANVRRKRCANTKEVAFPLQRFGSGAHYLVKILLLWVLCESGVLRFESSMKREGTIGAATLLAIAAVVGVSLQTGPKPDSKANQTSPLKRSKPSVEKTKTGEVRPGCSDLKDEFEEFLEVKELVAPGPCYKPGEAPGTKYAEDLTQKTSHLKFVIATLPDPVHTHLAVLFDQFTVSVQEGAQDEQYDFDSSWLPWDDQEASYALLLDEKAANEERELKERQPGIILFRKQSAVRMSTRKRIRSISASQIGGQVRTAMNYCRNPIVKGWSFS